MSEEAVQSVREAVGVFKDAKALEAAIDELESHGFDRAEISLLAGEAAVDEKLGHHYRKASDVEDNPDAPRTAYVGTEAIGDAEGGLIGGLFYVGAVAAAGAIVASGGTLAAVIGGAALAGGAGGAVGVFLASLVGEHHAEYLQKQLDHGGMLLWVRTRDEAHEQRARDIMSKHSASDVHIHDIPVT
mgnify:CR=1 FL=1